jgi:2-polyprenyl-3-methyl-5-hydroxy-6-metoxy-1,4-benzoquinol methylase
LPEKPDVLDLGCGPGYESMRLSRLGANVTGVDFSTESIRIARERCTECRFEVLDFRELDCRFGTFDGVFASGSLIHIEPDLFENIVTRVKTVLKRNGIFLFEFGW